MGFATWCNSLSLPKTRGSHSAWGAAGRSGCPGDLLCRAGSSPRPLPRATFPPTPAHPVLHTAAGLRAFWRNASAVPGPWMRSEPCRGFEAFCHISLPGRAPLLPCRAAVAALALPPSSSSGPIFALLVASARLPSRGLHSQMFSSFRYNFCFRAGPFPFQPPQPRSVILSRFRSAPLSLSSLHIRAAAAPARDLNPIGRRLPHL